MKGCISLAPKISVWDTGAGGGPSDPLAAVRNLYSSLPPLLDTVQQQTGITPPSWLVNMPPGEHAPHEKSQLAINGQKNAGKA